MAAPLLVMPEAELARLRREAAAPTATALDARALDARARHDRRLELRAKSEARMNRWSDTIEVSVRVGLDDPSMAPTKL